MSHTQMKKQIILAIAFIATFSLNTAFANVIENNINEASKTL